MLWLTGHWEWHALAAYVVVPLEGDPTLIYSMGGTHIEAVRRETSNALSDVRSSRSGKYAEVMVERLRELGLEKGRIGLLEIDPRHEDYLPVNQYNTLRAGLPEAEFVFTVGIMHELLSVHSAEELDAIRMSGKLCQVALEAMAERAQARRDRTAAARRDRRRRDGQGRRAGLHHSRLDADGQPLGDLRQPAALEPGAAARRHHHQRARDRLPRLRRPNRLADLHRTAERPREALLG